MMITSYLSGSNCGRQLYRKPHKRSFPAAGHRSLPSEILQEYGLRPRSDASTPPLKKKVTCAYFSVSAILACVMSMRCQILSEGVGQRDSFLNATHLVRDRHIILCEAYVYDQFLRAPRSKPSNSSQQKATGDLSCTVRTEVEEDDQNRRPERLQPAFRLSLLQSELRTHLLLLLA